MTLTSFCGEHAPFAGGSFLLVVFFRHRPTSRLAFESSSLLGVEGPPVPDAIAMQHAYHHTHSLSPLFPPAPFR